MLATPERERVALPLRTARQTCRPLLRYVTHDPETTLSPLSTAGRARAPAPAPGGATSPWQPQGRLPQAHGHPRLHAQPAAGHGRVRRRRRRRLHLRSGPQASQRSSRGSPSPRTRSSTTATARHSWRRFRPAANGAARSPGTRFLRISRMPSPRSRTRPSGPTPASTPSASSPRPSTRSRATPAEARPSPSSWCARSCCPTRSPTSPRAWATARSRRSCSRSA